MLCGNLSSALSDVGELETELQTQFKRIAVFPKYINSRQ